MAANRDQNEVCFRAISDAINKLASRPIDQQICINCIKELPNIALELGLESTQNVLLPLIQSLQFQEVAIVLPLLDCVIKLKTASGGPEEAHRFLPILEPFYKHDSTEVSNKTTDCLKNLFKDASAQVLTHHFVPFVKRLTTDHWPLTRAQTCGLYAVCYSRVPQEIKKELLSQYSQLCEDAIPCVRIEVARHLGELAKTTEFESVTEDIVPIFIKLASDKHESVRHLLIDTFFGISFRFIPRNVEQLLMPTMRKLFTDKSYLVRHRIASRFTELQKAVGTGITKSDLLPTMTCLLQDSCPEVRVPAILKIIDFWEHSPAASSCEKQLLDDILPALTTQSLHPCQQVRIALCNIVNLATVLGQRLKDHLLPILTTLMQDVNPIVRLTVADHIGRMKSVADIKLITEDLAPILEEQMRSAKDAQMRVIGLNVVKCLGQALEQEFFQKTLTASYLEQLVDSDAFTRANALFYFNNIVTRFGIDWLTENIVTFVAETSSGNHETQTELITWCINCLIENDQSNTVLSKETLNTIIDVCRTKDNLYSAFEKLLRKLETTCNPRIEVGECLKHLTEEKPHTDDRNTDLEHKIASSEMDSNQTNFERQEDSRTDDPPINAESTPDHEPSNCTDEEIEKYILDSEDKNQTDENDNESNNSTDEEIEKSLSESEDKNQKNKDNNTSVESRNDEAPHKKVVEFEEIAINSEDEADDKFENAVNGSGDLSSVSDDVGSQENVIHSKTEVH